MALESVKFQLTRPTKGPRRCYRYPQGSFQISTHAAHEGAAGSGKGFSHRCPISTHAAHEGAAIALTILPKLILISTHAAHEGAAMATGRRRRCSTHFNSRGPRRGRDHGGGLLCEPRRISTHAAHEGAAESPGAWRRSGHFNSRGPRRGRELGTDSPHGLAIFQLTRPTKGPRPDRWRALIPAIISTHAAHEGAARRRRERHAEARISTHAAHEGAAHHVHHHSHGRRDFNSRGPRRGRAASTRTPDVGGAFQLTRPTKGPRPTAARSSCIRLISTHAAHEGAAGHGGEA